VASTDGVVTYEITSFRTCFEGAAKNSAYHIEVISFHNDLGSGPGIKSMASNVNVIASNGC
jgi:hypothetical protein